METEARHLRLVPQSVEAAVVRAALRELHELAAPEHEAPALPAGSGTDSRRWHPSMGARLTAVR